MTYWKRGVVIGLALAMIGAGLTATGCGGESGDQETAGPDQSPDSTQRTQWRDAQRPPFGMGDSRFLDQLALDGVLTREQADQIVALMDDGEAWPGPGIEDSLDEAVGSGIITQEQADAITEFMESRMLGGALGMPEFGGRLGTAFLDAPVAEGIISQDQADQIMALMRESGGFWGGEMPDIFDQAVAQGIITQEQAGQLPEFIPEGEWPGRGGM